MGCHHWHRHFEKRELKSKFPCVPKGRDEIALDFSIDDTTGGEREDALVGMAFHVPKEATAYQPPDEHTASTMVSSLSRHSNTQAPNRQA